MANNLDFNKMQSLIDKMYSGDVGAIIEGLDHAGCLFRINAIISAYENDIHEKAVIERIKGLKTDEADVDSISVGDYAKAVLHLYGIEKYDGTKKYVRHMIDSKMDI